MITVNRVYVDAEGYIEDRDGHRFEDQEQIKKLMHDIYPVINPDLFYTIEPIQVELVEVMSEGWMPTYNNPDNSGCEPPAEPITVARIVTEEEKPAPFSGNIKAILKGDDEGIRLAVEEYARQNGLKLVPEDRVSELKDLTANGNNLVQPNPEEQPRQPAPVVDKPGYDSQDHLWAKVAAECNWIESEGVWHVIERLKQLFTITPKSQTVQQPTEWIPVSTQPENKTRHIVMGRMEGTSERSLYIAKIYRADTWNAQAWMVAGKHIHDVTHYLPLSSLPEPPKP